MNNYDFLRKIAVDIFSITNGGLNIHSFKTGTKISEESYIVAIVNVVLQLVPFLTHMLTYKYGKSPFKDRYVYRRINNSKEHNNIKDFFNVLKYILNIAYSIMTIVYYSQKKNADEDMYGFSIFIIIIDIFELMFYTVLYRENSKIYAKF